MSRRQRRELREEMRRILMSLDKRWIAAASSELAARLKKLVGESNQSLEHVLVFAPYFTGEVDLSSFINWALERYSVYLPCVSEKGVLSFFSISKNWKSELVQGLSGVPEPALSGNAYDVREAHQTACIVPGLAFDKDGNRLSQDKGLYDIFLRKGAMPESLKLGVCWSLQLVPEVHADSHHIMMDYVCHERGIVTTARDFDEDFEE